MKEFIEKLINRLEEHCGIKNEVCDCNGVCSECDFRASIEIANQFAEEYNNGWIPCSERLPEVEADVLISLRSLDVYTGFMANTEGCFYVDGEGYTKIENVLAWQPLPAPYQPKGE